MAALWSCIRYIEIVQCHILNNLFLLMDFSFWDWYVLFSLKIEICCVGVSSSYSFYSSSCGFDVNNISDLHFLLLDVLVDARVQF